MSSLAAARADNFYYPKDWRPEDGSLNTFHGSHALGKRAKRLASDGVLVVRFEMPFNVWCLHCERHIGRGVRFNAKKKKVGMYFSTIRYEFRLTCAQCAGEMVIETDPEHRGYKLVSGVQKQRTAQDEDEDAATGLEEMGTERLDDPHVGLQAAADPFFRLEHEQSDKERAKQRARGLEAVLDVQEKQFKDDYTSNAVLRAGFRQKKKHLQSNARRADALGLGIPLVDAADEDVLLSKATVFQGIHGNKRKLQRKEPMSKKLTAKKEDTFRYFGDEKASKLHQLKKRKQEQKAARSLVQPTPSRPKTPVDRIQSTAKRLSERR